MRLAALLIAALPLLAAAASPPAPADLPGLDGLKWRLIGPFRGGRVLAVAGVPGEREHFYFGSVNGGVWESRDAGRTWQPRFDQQDVGSIGALAVAPSAPRTLYVGTGEADMRSNIAHGNGMYRSDDGGMSWQHIGLEQTFQIGRILVDPSDAQTVYVAALGHAYGPNPERGVYRSRDGGRSWTRILFHDAETGAIDLAFQPGDPRTIYAALWQTRRPPWSVYPPSNGPGSGLYRSRDGGDTWEPLTGHGLPDQPGRIGLAVAPSRPDRVYAMIDAPKGGLYRSDDAGTSWTQVSSDFRIWQRGWYFGGITVDPRDPDVVYACNTSMYRSRDGGKTFVPIKGEPGGDDYHTLWIDPDHPERQMLGVDQGALVTLNRGETWSSWFNQPTGQFYHVATDGHFPYRVYGSQQDSGAAVVPSRTDSIDAINLTNFRELVAGGESDEIAPDPRDPEVIYGGRVDRFDMRTQQTHSVDPTLAYPGQYRSAWTLPLTFSKRDPTVLYFGNQRIFRTADGGNHWQPISPDLSRESLSLPPNLDEPTIADHAKIGDRRGVVYSIAPSPLKDGLLWAGTDDGLIWRTDDDGQHWQNVTPAGLQPWSKIATLEASHFEAARVYAAVDRHRLDDDRPYIYASEDGGATWALRVDGIPANQSVNVVREDPIRRGLLFAGTERGVYVSFNDGVHWQALQSALPVTSVRDIEVHGADLVIATHGRAFWALDDISVLRDVSARSLAGPAWLARPTDAVRLRRSEFTGTPMPRDEAIAPNPPDGAAIYYHLRDAPTSPVTLTITDPKGQTVRRYSSVDATPAPDVTKLQTTSDWVQAPATLAAGRGLHRLVWDLRYQAAPGRIANDPSATGAWAPPGVYTVTLEANGTRATHPLTLRPDPRIDLQPSAYQGQFDAATLVDGMRGRLAQALADAETLRNRLDASAAGSAPALPPHLAEAGKMIEEIADLEPAGPARTPSRPASVNPNGLRALSEIAAKLAKAIDGADGAPSIDAQSATQTFIGECEKTLARWTPFRTKAESELGTKHSIARTSLAKRLK